MALCQETLNLIIIAFFAGFIGDALLQFLSPRFGGKTGWGLKPYFAQHGSAESLFIAAGMMTLFYIIYLCVLRLPASFLFLAIYGIVLDLLFRIFQIFPSLSGYYTYLNFFWSAVWGAIPMMLPLSIYMVA